MKIKKFRADSIKDALKMVRNELGANAVILKTQQVVKDGFLGMIGKTEIEVTAAIDYDPSDSSGITVTPPSENNEDTLESVVDTVQIRKEPIRASEERYSPQQFSAKGIEQEIAGLRSTIEQLKETVLLQDRITFTGYYKELFIKLMNNDVEEYIAYQIIEKLFKELGDVSPDTINERLRALAGDLLSLTKGISVKKSNYVVMFIGPTGVGKTTTLAKLAANAVIYQNKKVGLLTIDTFRLGAVEQLKTFANILDLPIEIAYTSDDISGAMRRFADKDVIFVDTVGRSPGDSRSLEELEKYCNMLNPDEVYCVMSATSKIRDMYETVKRFNVFRIDKLIFTKLDETTTFGFLLSMSINVNRPLAYVTNGQNIPEDILNADRKYLVAKLLKGV